MDSFTLPKLIYHKHAKTPYIGRGKQVELLKLRTKHENMGAKSEKPRYVMTYKKSCISLHNEIHYYVITSGGTKSPIIHSVHTLTV